VAKNEGHNDESNVVTLYKWSLLDDANAPIDVFNFRKQGLETGIHQPDNHHKTNAGGDK
tara:strand:- start:3199 stop:3375 length:177 start_codon:yes stop_codon:yes gene_type:complete